MSNPKNKRCLDCGTPITARANRCRPCTVKRQKLNGTWDRMKPPIAPRVTKREQ